MKSFDYVIVGAGLAGSLLAIELMKRNKRVAIIHDTAKVPMSRVAAGLYNPITGRLMSKTWLADEIFHDLDAFYTQLEQLLQAKFHHALPIYRPFINADERIFWEKRSKEDTYAPYIQYVSAAPIGTDGILDSHGGLMLNHCGYVEVPKLLDAAFHYFRSQAMLFQQDATESQPEMVNGKVIFGEFEANHIIYCEGYLAAENPLWRFLKFKPVKGEVLDVQLPLNQNFILNRGVFVIPGVQYHKLGATYDHHDLSLEPTEKARMELLTKLSKIWTTLPQVVGHRTGIRPATFDRRPFIGTHPDFSHVSIFNGFGSKGVSLVPYFSRKMADWLLDKKPLMTEVSLNR